MVQRRSDLQLSEQTQQGKRYLIVKDPLTGRFFRFTEAQAQILNLMDSPLSVEELAERAAAMWEAPVDVATIQGFVDSLEQKLLLETPEVRSRIAEQQGRQPRSSILYRKAWSFNPTRLLAWLYPKVRFAFSVPFHLVAITAIAAGAVLAFLNAAELWAQLPGLLSIDGIVTAWLVIFIVTTMHEFAHGLTCVHFGGQVREMGVMWIYFQPAFYCDVSDTYMFRERRQRIWVTFAGGYFQLTLWGGSVLLWRLTDPDTWISQFTIVIVLFAGLQTLVNFNPLIKLDGYYMLSDWLEVPNLRARALERVWAWVEGGRAGNNSRDRAQLIYGVMALLFSWALLVYVYAVIFGFATDRFRFAGLMGFMVFLGLTLHKATGEASEGARAIKTRLSRKRFVWGGSVLAIGILSFLIPWELKISSDFRIVAKEERTIRAETDGVVIEVPVREGMRVASGGTVARLRDFGKRNRTSELEGLLVEKRRQLDLLRAGARPEEIDTQRRIVETKRMELQNARRYVEQRNQLQQTLERKRSELELDRENLKRAQNLSREGLIPRAELDRAETTVRVREREIGEAEASIRTLAEGSDREADLKSRELATAESGLRLLMAGSRPEVLKQQEAEVARLESQLNLLSEENQRTEIVSPIEGVVATPFVERRVGQFLEAGDEFCRIVGTETMLVEMLVPEKEMADVQIGSQVWFKLRSRPQDDYLARTEFIAPTAQDVGGQRMVVVRAEVPNPAQIFRSDMTGVAKIYAGRRSVFEIATRRLIRWIRTEFWDLLP